MTKPTLANEFKRGPGHPVEHVYFAFTFFYFSRNRVAKLREVTSGTATFSPGMETRLVDNAVESWEHIAHVVGMEHCGGPSVNSGGRKQVDFASYQGSGSSVDVCARHLNVSTPVNTESDPGIWWHLPTLDNKLWPKSRRLNLFDAP